MNTPQVIWQSYYVTYYWLKKSSLGAETVKLKQDLTNQSNVKFFFQFLSNSYKCMVSQEKCFKILAMWSYIRPIIFD
jgi:hypothetical protein